MLSDDFYSQPHLFQPPIEAISALGCNISSPHFRKVLMTAPRLLQVDGSDPFFQAQVINMSMIRQCYECKLFKSYSWRALQDMLIKVGNNLDYDADKKAHNNFDTSFRKLHSLAKGSFNEFRHFIQPEDPKSKQGDPTFKQDSIEGAGKFIICRIRALKAGVAENCANNGFVLMTSGFGRPSCVA
ncbi:hypothetical protein MJO29_014117 [Puccinia striiformis f. sp. tritici]|uniref:hypothetical protein n=1 Tax=Puccinia striiformis f. sp. tritici TaxID=168172 RepID=UPI002007EE55|nr:hypothetical protein Pst134EA_026712 [Puccinia striiformis f. sp. tritici]KAH9449999.1 hypothetical protein Pst134EA_026712 [Puccinia striiformis f. sp. tritici]KAI7939381.1 hypothetical protein MJO29_014117 [Puccinia striiformis f. sp. tritici]